MAHVAINMTRSCTHADFWDVLPRADDCATDVVKFCRVLQPWPVACHHTPGARAPCRLQQPPAQSRLGRPDRPTAAAASPNERGHGLAARVAAVAHDEGHEEAAGAGEAVREVVEGSRAGAQPTAHRPSQDSYHT